MLVIKIGNTFVDVDKNVFNNILEMQEIIVPYAWHSFCITIDLEKSVVKLYHNDHIQVKQNFEVKHDDKEGLSKLMTRGHLGGPQFVGILTDFQIFGTVLSLETILKWTSCKIQVGFYLYMLNPFLLLFFYRKLVTCTHCSILRLSL